jgi:hypothetical protein
MANFYIFLTSDDSLNLYPDNKPSSFTIDLGNNINLQGEWECALKEITYHINEDLPQTVYVLCNKCEQSYARNTYMPILRRLHFPLADEGLFTDTLYEPFYMKVIDNNLSNITISIRGHDDADVNFDYHSIKCVLHFKKKN